MLDKQLAYLLARITLGVNFLLHGFVRIPKLTAFAEGITKGFENTMLPLSMVEAFSYALPFIELILGILLTLGVANKKTLVSTAILIILLISGSAFKEDWNAIATQMLYALFIIFLIRNLKDNVWSVTRN